MGSAVEDFRPLSPEFVRDPFPVIKRLQSEEPVFFCEALNCWVITRHADIQRVASDPAVFSSQALAMLPPPADLADKVEEVRAERIIISLDPPGHTEIRQAFQSGFKPSDLAKLEAPITEYAGQLIDVFIDDGAADLMQQFCLPLTMRTITRLLGLPSEMEPDLLQWAEDFFFLFVPRVEGVDPLTLRPVDPAHLRERWSRLADANQYCWDYVKYRQRHPGDDLVSNLLQAKDEKGSPIIPELEIVRNLIALVGAGHDTTANSIAHMVYHLSRNLDQRDQLVADMSLASKAVEEGLRIRGSSPGTFRVATQDVELGGRSIRRGDLIWVLFYAGGHDEAVFPNSQQFDMRRENAARHTGFGFGVHTCLGNRLARMQARIALTELYGRMPDLRLAPGFEPSYMPLLTVTALQELKVVWGS